MPKQLNYGKQRIWCDGYDIYCAIAAITSREVSDKQLAAFFHESYYDVGKKHDNHGRTALHMAASCGRSELCEWLISVAGTNINCRDWESCYTPLQRALFHGRIKTAVKLMMMGADLTLVDKEGLTAIDIVTKDRPKQVVISNYEPCQVYVWGINDNYTLGIGTNESRRIPYLMDNFKWRNVSIAKVYMDEYHSVFVGNCNRVWVCGNGQGGRLGISSEKHVLVPSLLANNIECIMAAVALNHTLVLLSTKRVLACGQNEHYQLGISPYAKVSKSLRPVSIKSQEDLKGICAGKYHSIFYTERSIYVCGLNGGQLGLSADKNSVPYVKVPTQVPINLKSDSTITAVSTSTTCVAFSLSCGNIYILYQFMFKKIASKQLHVQQIGTIGGVLKTDVASENVTSLKVVLLTLGGSILIWQESVPQLTRCMFGLNRHISITSIFLNEVQILFTTKNGEAFSCTIGQIEKQTVASSKEDKSGYHQFLEKSECYHVKAKRIPNVHRAVAISSDPKGKNYAVRQVNPYNALTEIPAEMQNNMVNHFLQFLEETSEQDPLHDIKFKAQNTLFPAHKYIIACAETSLLTLPMDDDIIVVNDVLPPIFKEILMYIYTGQCSLLKTGPVSLRFANCTEDPLKLLMNASSKYKVSSLYKKALCFKYENGHIKYKSENLKPAFIPPKFSRDLYPELHDVIVKSEDGKLVKAHKCILAARLDYFHSMMMGGWSESISTPVLHLECPIKALEVLLDFLYTNEIPLNTCTESFEHLRRLLIISDQLLFNDLREICEISLVNSLTLKNAATMLQVSCLYNAPQLKKSVMQYIILNLDTIIENRALEILSDDILLELDEYNRSFNSDHYNKRIITPYSEGIELAETVKSAPPIIWPENMLEIKIKNQKEKSQNTSTTPLKKKSIPPRKPLINEVLPEETYAKNAEVTLKTTKNEQIARSPPVTEPILNILDFPDILTLDSQNKHTVPNNKVHYRVRQEFRRVFPPKLSQKERKKISLEHEEKQTMPATEKSSKSQFKGWTTIPPPETLDYQEVEKNVAVSPPNISSFVEIIASEKKEKDNFFKMKAKSFTLTQLEDKAMEDLYEFYNASNVFDEKITVQRVLPINVAKPTWITSHKKNSH